MLVLSIDKLSSLRSTQLEFSWEHFATRPLSFYIFKTYKSSIRIKTKHPSR